VSGDGQVEILDHLTGSFKEGFAGSKMKADLIGPLGPENLRQDQLESVLEMRLSPGWGEPRQTERKLGYHWLGNQDV
jgi:hypothetical protein